MPKAASSILQFWYEWTIPMKVMGSSYLYQKAVVLTRVHLLLLCFSLFYIYAKLVLDPENAIPFYVPISAAVMLIYIFKKRGSFELSGNLLAICFFMTLAPMTFTSGGLYSDNLLWMGAIPFIAFLFAGRFSGILWLASLELFIIYLYRLEINSDISYRDQIAGYPPDYFLASWMLLFGVFTFIVYLFAKGESQIVHQLRENELQLIQQKNELSEQAKELKANQRELQELNENLEHFTYAASHDLKEPLRMIKMYTQMLRKSLKGRLDGNETEFMGFVTDGTERMQRLLDDLLQYSKLKNFDSILKEVDFNDTLLLVQSNVAGSVREKNAKIVIEGNFPVVMANPTLSIQLFQNLISNAIKFKHPDRDPIVRVGIQTDEDTHTISIADNGIGIPKDSQDKIFDVFTRLHSQAEYEGTGIGLATCKKIVQAMKGDIWLESEQGEGTTFFFTVPKIHISQKRTSKAELNISAA
ncbi:MAG: ATP-binding protein [Bacteroidota bacterium]